MKIVITCLFCFSFLPCLILGQEMRDSLAEVVITDSKIQRPVRNTIRPIQIISKETLQNYRGKQLSEILEEQSGITINGSSSNPASIKNVYLRGAAPGYTLILVNGVPMTDASIIGSTLDIRLLDVGQIERIEIAKGSHSTLYGSDAIAGVINIITKSNDIEKFSLNGTGSIGSFNSKHIGGGVQGKLGKIFFQAGYNFEKSDGLSEAADPIDSGTYDKDGLKKNSGNTQFAIKVSEAFSISANMILAQFEGEYDTGSFVDGSDEYESKLFAPGVQFELIKNKFNLKGAYNHVRSKRSFFTEFGNFLFDGKTHNADVYATFNFGHFKLIGGLANQNASIDQQDGSGPHWNLISSYSNLLYQNGQFQFEAGARFNNHSNFGNNFNFNISPAILIRANTKVYTSYSTAFKAPALDELYSGFGGNPNLDPQRSKTFEAGIRLYFDDFEISTTYFNRVIDDVIVFISKYENFSKQKDQGIEFDITLRSIPDIQIDIGYTFLDGYSVDGSSSESRTYNLYKRPKHQVQLKLQYSPTDSWNVVWTSQCLSDRKDLFFDFNTFSSSEVNLKSYFLSNLTARFQFNPKFEVYGHLNNLFDNPYFETYGFNTSRLSGKIGIYIHI